MAESKVPYLSHLSVKIGVIVAGASVPLYVVFELEPKYVFVMLFALSWILWCFVWKFIYLEEQKNTIFKKPFALFGIHILATALTPFFVGQFIQLGLWS